VSKQAPHLSWNDRFALIDHFKPTDEQICTAFHLSADELSVARQLRDQGTFIASQNFDVQKYQNLFTPSASQTKSTATIHTKPETATKKSVIKVPQKRGRKGNKIQAAFLAIPTTPMSVESFIKDHNVSVAVLRQSKRFIQSMEPTIQQQIGKINVRLDKESKKLMIWKEV
jgi:hypothetical protein